MRVFIAIYPPEDLQKRIWKAGNLVTGRWKREPPEKLHITLKFIGEVDEKRLKLIENALSALTYQPFSVVVKGVGAFPNEQHPRVIWVGATEEGLSSLHEKVEEVLYPLGIPREGREFVPHITLGRAKGKVKIDEFIREYKDYVFGEFRVVEFFLLESKLLPDGSVYNVLRRYRLED